MVPWTSVAVCSVSVAVAAALNPIRFAAATDSDEAETSIADVADLAPEILREHHTALCAPFHLPLSDSVCLSLAVTAIIVILVKVAPPTRSLQWQASEVSGVLLLCTCLVHYVRKIRGVSLQKHSDKITQVLGLRAWETLNSVEVSRVVQRGLEPGDQEHERREDEP